MKEKRKISISKNLNKKIGHKYGEKWHLITNNVTMSAVYVSGKKHSTNEKPSPGE